MDGRVSGRVGGHGRGRGRGGGCDRGMQILTRGPSLASYINGPVARTLDTAYSHTQALTCPYCMVHTPKTYIQFMC